MFGTIILETALYVTKSYKSDLITQKAQRVKVDTEKRRFEHYYHSQKTADARETQSQNGVSAPNTSTTGVATKGLDATEDGDGPRDRGVGTR